jgi:hypothetical protein
MNPFKRFITWLTSKYHSQREIIVVQPLKRNANPIPIKFQMEGVILETDPKVHSLSKGGTSQHVTLPKHWCEALTPPFQLHLYQTDKKGVIMEEVGGEQQT